MLGSDKVGLHKLLLTCRKYLDLFATVPYTWNRKTKQFVLKSGRCLGLIKVKCCLATLYLIFYILQSVHISSRLSLPLYVQCLFYLVFYGVGTYSLFFQWKNSKDIVNLLNGMLLFESKQNTVDGFGNHRIKFDWKKKCGVYLIQSLVPMATLLPILGQISFYRKPCNPTYPGYFLVEECQLNAKSLPESSILRNLTLPIHSNAIQIVLIVCAAFCRLWMLHALCFDLSVYMILKPLCLNAYIKAAENWITGFRRKGHKRHSIVSRACILHRQIHLLLQSYNQLNGQNIFTVAIVYIVSMATASMYVFVNWGKYLTFGKFIITAYTAIALFVEAVTILGIMADIHQKSAELIDKIKDLNSCKRHRKMKGRQLWIKSLAPGKIYLGYSNFVEKCTPMVTLNFVVQRTVELSIMT